VLTFAGTWAAPGTGFPSDVAAGCADVADEIPVQGPNSFGPIPPYGGQGMRAPSYQESVAISVDWAVQWTLDHPDRPVIAGGYSQGGEAASRYRMEFEPGGRLEHLRRNFVCGYTFGNPSRHEQHTYYGGPATPFEGIAEFRLPRRVCGDEWCELIDPGDLYGTSARGLTGEIERDVYSLCTEMELHSGVQQFTETLVANLTEVIKNLDGDAYDDLQRGITRHGIDLSAATILPSERINVLTERLLSVRGIACAVAAAIDALIFFCSPPYPTASHCEYGIRECWPGMTYVGLGIQHCHDWLTQYYQAAT
jgi:hypothetical protein